MIDLKAAAQAYHEQGIPVIPFQITKKDNGEWDKRPKVSTWQKWETEPQTEEDFQGLKWDGVNGFGVILGGQAKNGLYLAVVDYDTKGATVSEEAKAKGKEILKELPTTQTQQTVNNGMHLIYYSRAKPHTEGTFHDSTGLELLGDKKICIMAPSFGYKNLNDNSPTEVQDLETVFYAVLAKHGFQLTEETEIQNQQDSYSFNITKLVDITKLVKVSPDEYQGSHPIHDSTTEKNFHINTRANTWYCFRHGSGGGALQYLAVKEGLIKCEQAKRGALRGKKFKDVLNLAVAQGLIDEKVLTQSEINPVLLAKSIMEDHIFTVDRDINTLYFYDPKEGIYVDNTEQLIKREIARRLDENFKARYYSEINEFITATAPLVQMDNAQPEILAVENGLLNIITRKLEPYSSNVYITSKMNVKYLPEAKCPENMRFLSEVMQDEKHRIQAKEFVGHCFYRKIIVDVSAICLGNGGNGKSIWLAVITRLLGPKNVSGHSIQKLCYDPFVTGEIRGKYANIHADLPNKELFNTGIYKQLTSGDRTTGYIKHVQKTFEFDPSTKYLFSANETPPVASAEDCHAWYRRFVIWDFKRVFDQNSDIKPIPRQVLLAKLTTPEELSGLLNWGLDGFDSLFKNGDLSYRPSVEEIRRQYIRRSSSALAYFEDKVTVTDNENDFVFTDPWFRDYVTYCHQNGLRPRKIGEFLAAVKNHLPGAEKTRIRPDKDSNALSAYRFVKFVSAVSAVSTSVNFTVQKEKNTLMKFSILNDIVQKADTADTKMKGESLEKTGKQPPEPEEKVCGHCALWHKPGCSYPDGESSCVAPTNKFAGDCRDYLPKGNRPEPATGGSST